MAKLGRPLQGEIWITQTYHTQSNNTAVDFSAVAETPVYAMADGVVTYRSSLAGSYCIQSIDNSDLKIYYVHTYRWVGANTYVRKGDIICYVAPTSVNGGYPTHLHCGLPVGKYLMNYMDRSIVFRTKYQAIKDVWFIGENLNWALFKDLSYENTVMNFKIGNRVEFTGEQYVRAGAGDKFVSLRSSVIGEKGEIKDEPRSSQNAQFGKGANDSYTWYDIAFDNGSSGWVADVGKFKIVEPVKPPEPPVDPEPTECEKQITILNEKIQALESTTGLLEGNLKVSEERVGHLEGVIAEERVESKKLQEQYNELVLKEAKAKQENIELIAEVSALKLQLQEGNKNFIKKILDAIGEWLSRI